MNKRFPGFWRDLPIREKLFTIMLTMSVLFLSGNRLLDLEMDAMIDRTSMVHSSNVDLAELSDTLGTVQQYLYRYLEVRDYDSLDGYYKATNDYRALL